ncbi:GNAT family N-acetyltransferase [Sporolactobacillus sp. STSJ-5]|jgi:GNAT superfamily N-acetyltransferase|uniref:GNAT family N-acetyltransferase n=1 Tax=Sporolactobacillus sp. STSJ-5 TaxID=2965076 RepID=UPI0021070158|nr:GNAT family N-acetyltransferase [Sporolactobacillus sp. STSJ-5]MCQ2009579.1 GNAT family N-acetyltransferase [Sporolactobacillus sp. STSJ-5]
MTYIYRKATLADTDAYYRLIHSAYASIRELGIHFAAATADREQIVRHLRGNAVYVIEEEGELVSSLSLRFPWGPNPGPYGLPHIGWFATAPSKKNSGLGKNLLHWVEETVLIQQLHLPAVTLGTADSHPWLASMYESLGFVKVGTADLKKGHITIYFLKVLDQQLYEQWRKTNPLTVSTQH